MTTLYVDKKGLSAYLDGNAIVFRDKTQRVGTVPIAPLDRVFFRGEVMVDTRLLSHLGEKGVGVLILSGREHRPTLFHPRVYKDACRRMLQYRCRQNMSFRLHISRKILSQKFTSSILFLRTLAQKDPNKSYFLKKSEDKINRNLLVLESVGNLEALRGLEGTTAKIYFEALAYWLPDSLGFRERNRRPPRDPFNAVLSLGYTMLTSEVSLACQMHGLDPYVPFLHELSYGRESLSCDLVEPFRSAIDEFSVGLFESKALTKEMFTNETNGCFMGKEARSVLYPAYEKIRDSLSKRIADYVMEICRELENGSEESNL